MKGSRSSWTRRAAIVAAALAGAAALAVWATWPMATHMRRHVLDPEQTHGAFAWTIRPDIYLQLWVLAWDAHALVSAPLSLFDAPIFHPAPRALATHDHMLGAMPLYFPVAWWSGNPVFAGQWVLLCTFALAVLAGAALVKEWTGSAAAAVLAGCLYAFSPYRSSQLGAVNLLSNYYLPLIPLCMYRAAAAPGLLWPALLALVMLMQGLNSFQVTYAALAQAVVIAAVAFACDRDARRAWRRIVLPVFAGTAAAGLAAIPYAINSSGGTIHPPTPGFLAMSSARPGSLQATPLALALAGLGIALWRRGVAARGGGAWALGIALAGLVAHALALGPSIVIGDYRFPGPWAVLSKVVPGMEAVRVPIRFNAVATMSVATLAGIGAAGALRLCDAFARGRAGLLARALPRAAVLAAAAWTVQNFLPGPMRLREIETRETIPPAYRWLATAPPGAVVELPFREFETFSFDRETEALRAYRTIYHWHPVANGYSAYPPATYRLVAAIAQRLPEPDAVDLLVRLAGVRYAVISDDLFFSVDEAAWRGSGLRAVRFPGHTIYELPLPEDAPPPVLGQAPGLWKDRSPTGVPLDPLPGQARRGGVIGPGGPITALAGLPTAEFVEVENHGDLIWPGVALPGTRGVALRYRIRDAQGRILPGEPTVTPLGVDIAPGQRARVPLWFWAPTAPGRYDLEAFLIQDGIGPLATASRRIPLEVVAISP